MSRKWFRRRGAWIAAALVVVLAVGGFLLLGHQDARAELAPFSDLLAAIDRGGVSAVAANGDLLEAVLADGTTMKTLAPAGYVAANPSFVSNLVAKGIRFDVKPAAESTAYNYGGIVLAAAFLGLLAVTLYRVSSGRIPALESKTREADPEAVAVTFADVAGVDEAKDEVREIVDFLRNPERVSRPSAAAFPKAFCSSALRGRAKRFSRVRSRAKRVCRSSSRADLTSSRCTPGLARRASAGCSRTRGVVLRASCSSTSSTPSVAAAEASRSATKSASRRSISCSSRWTALPRTAGSW